MANGYGGSSGSSGGYGSSSRSSDNGRRRQASSDEQEFVKELNGQEAPAGFHYMANGKLMSDADHIAVYGRVQKTIDDIEISTQDISYLGETKKFKIIGETGSFFSLEIYDDSDNYYDFDTNRFSSSKKRLSRVKLGASGFNGSIVFPVLGFVDATCDYNNDPTITHDDDDGAIEAGMLVTGAGIPDGATVSSVTSDTAFELSVSTTGGATTNSELRFSKLKTYTINLIAETVLNVQTTFPLQVQSNYIDGSIDKNNSSGSNSNMLQRVIYQDVEKKLYLSCIAPSLYATSTSAVDGTVSSSNRIVLATRKYPIVVGDLVTFSGVSDAVWLLLDKVDPDGDNVNEIEVNKAISVSDGVTVTFSPPFNGITPHSDDSTTGRHSESMSTGGNATISFTIDVVAPAGRAMSIVKIPTVEDLCVFKEITIGSAASAISGEDTDSASKFHRWPVTNIAGLSENMMLDPSRAGGGIRTTTPARIASYETTITTQNVVKDKYNTTAFTTEIQDIYVAGVVGDNDDITAIDRNGNVTAQAGNVTFDVQQEDAFKADSGVRIFGYGEGGISSITNGMEVTLNNVNLELAQVSTTTTAASSSSTTIALTDVGAIRVGSEVRGVNINSAVVNPTVTYKSANDGAGNVIVSSAQTLEDGQTLFFDGTGSSLTISGTISVSNMPLSDTTLFFDLERFINIL